MNYSRLNSQQKALLLRDMATASEYGALPADRRVQVKMPAFVVEELDKAFPNSDRSQVLTRAAIELVLNKLRFADRPDLGEIVKDEQAGLTTMWQYLEKRDAS